ncbi:uncharacterized protein METZ01_LOCUS445512, partial [marine metagenome]
MGDELTREEVTERLEAIYSEALEGKDLKKRLANIPKTLDKYEGKWPGLLKAAEKKFAKADSDELGDSEENNDSEDEAEEESAEEEVTESEVEKPAKKRGGFLSRFGKSKDEDSAEDESEDEEPADSEDEAEEESDDVEDEALEWTEGDVPPEEESGVAPSDENADSTLEMALSMIEEGDS